jgi:biotin carboxyl carrier protein
VIGDGSGSVSHLGERECSIQRRHQKLVEIAPSPTLSADLRDAICAAAVRMAEAVSYQSLGTFEFLVDATAEDSFVFIEANARLQVEHTVTEEVTGVDLVAAQLRLAQGESLKDLGLEQVSVPQARGFAIQARVNTEVLQPDGSLRPSGGQLTTFQLPAGPGVRVDTYAAAGYTTNPNFDSLLAKVIVHSPSDDFGAASRRLGRVLGEFQIGGPETNIGFLSKVLEHDDFVAQNVYTRWLDDHMEELAMPVATDGNGKAATIQAGADINRKDPLASLDFFRGGEPTRQTGTAAPPRVVGPPNTDPVPAPLQGTVSEILVAEGDEIREGQLLMVMSALKMEHEVEATFSGVVRELTVSVGEIVFEDHPLAFVEPMEVGAALVQEERAIDIDYIRPSLQAVFDRRQFLLDENRPEAVERRHSKGRRTVRENIDQLIDPGTWTEYGSLAISTPRAGLSLADLIRKTPADGLVAGIGSVNGDLFDAKRARTIFISYDDTVYAGTQGGRGHDKTDRMVELADDLSLPVIFHAEGAGARSGSAPPEAPQYGPSGRGHPATRTFERMAQLSGKVLMIGVTAGWCYAGNASILGLTDIIIATEDSLIAVTSFPRTAIGASTFEN